MKKDFSSPILFVLIAWLLSGCANIQSPTGGPKDRKPPTLLSTIPKPNQTRYKGTILLTFDETVKLNNPKEEIIISPSPGKDIEYVVKNNKVFITPKTPWKDSTTYSIAFREGIQDITESNSPVNLKLAFSTGETIDSLSIGGQVTDLLRGTPKDKITVAIYSSDTFNIFSHTPSYFTRTDKSGTFLLENIRAGKYWIYAFDDKNKNLKVESRSEMFAFLASPISLSQPVDTIRLPLVQLDTRPIKVTTIRNTGNITRVRFNKGILDYQLTTDKSITSAFGENTTEVNIWNPAGGDSLMVSLTARDSLQEQTDTTFYIRYTDAKPITEKFSIKLGGPTINPETGRLTTTLSFTKPIRQLLMDSLFVKIDTTDRLPVLASELTYSPKHKQYDMIKDLGKKYFGPDDNPSIVLMMKRAFAISIDGDTSNSVSEQVVIYWAEETGVVNIQANTKRSHFIIQLLTTSEKVIAQSINNARLTAKNIPPGEYQLRVILDTNKNGSWDPGNFRTKTEPESVIYYRAADGSTKIPVRANWEIGPLQFNF